MLITKRLTAAVIAAHGEAIRATVASSLRELATEAATSASDQGAQASVVTLAAEAQATGVVEAADADGAEYAAHKAAKFRRQAAHTAGKIQESADAIDGASDVFLMLADRIEAGDSWVELKDVLSSLQEQSKAKPTGITQVKWDQFMDKAPSGKAKRKLRGHTKQARVLLRQLAPFFN